MRLYPMAPLVTWLIPISAQAVLAGALTSPGFLPGTNLACIDHELLSCGDPTLGSAKSCCVESPGGELVHPQIWDSQPPRGPVNSWTIHGLWPNYCGGHGWQANCDPSRNYTNIDEVLKENDASSLLPLMNKYWIDLYGPNERLWEHEWAKHGTCLSTLRPSCWDEDLPRGFEAVIYFQTAVKLFESFPTYQWLESAGIIPSRSRVYTRSEILSALTSASGVTPSIQCKRNILNGVSWHFHLRGPISGAEFVPSRCAFVGILSYRGYRISSQRLKLVLGEPSSPAAIRERILFCQALVFPYVHILYHPPLAFHVTQIVQGTGREEMQENPVPLSPPCILGIRKFLRNSVCTIKLESAMRISIDATRFQALFPLSTHPPETFFVLQFHPEQELPPCILKDMTYDSGRFFSLTRTQNEVSLVGDSRKEMPDKYKEYSTWICIKIAGPMDHNMVGALADLTTPLKAAKVPVFITSTWNTDYVLVPKDMLLEAVNALERDGWIFASTRQHRMARL